METITHFTTAPLENPKFVHPVSIHFNHKGIAHQWEAVTVHDSVAILLFHTQKNAFVLVKQFRPPVYLHNGSDGFTYELCAGILDKATTPLQTAKEEIQEECGFDVPLDQIHRVTSFYTAVGFAGSQQTLYYAHIDDTMKKDEGGGIDGEVIELIYLPRNEALAFVMDETRPKTPGVMFALYWFLAGEGKGNFS
jgi:UDP-sugar diphosphatase